MMRRRRNPQNLWLLLSLPIIGAVGWVIGRFMSSRKINPRDTIMASRERPAEDLSSPQAQESMSEYHPRETGQKETGKETKLLSTGAKQGEAAVPAAGARAAHTGHALENQPERLSTFLVFLIPFLILPIAVIVLAFQHTPVQSQAIVPGGDPNRGQAELQSWGCGSCHNIPGVTGATGAVGPGLNNLTNRSYIAGHLRNTPDNMIQWIMKPQEISPGVDMPDSAVPESVARDMAAYLYSIHK